RSRRPGSGQAKPDTAGGSADRAESGGADCRRSPLAPPAAPGCRRRPLEQDGSEQKPTSRRRAAPVRRRASGEEKRPTSPAPLGRLGQAGVAASGAWLRLPWLAPVFLGMAVQPTDHSMSTLVKSWNQL